MDEAQLRAEYVMPFYMMSATEEVERSVEIAAAASTAAIDDVLALIGHAGWREQKVGALFSIVRAEPEIVDAVLHALESSRGWFTFPYLCASAMLNSGEHAISSLQEFQRQTHASSRPEVACSEVATAALEVLGATSEFEASTDKSRETLDTILANARALRGAAGL